MPPIQTSRDIEDVANELSIKYEPDRLRAISEQMLRAARFVTVRTSSDEALRNELLFKGGPAYDRAASIGGGERAWMTRYQDPDTRLASDHQGAALLDDLKILGDALEYLDKLLPVGEGRRVLRRAAIETELNRLAAFASHIEQVRSGVDWGVETSPEAKPLVVSDSDSDPGRLSSTRSPDDLYRGIASRLNKAEADSFRYSIKKAMRAMEPETVNDKKVLAELEFKLRTVFEASESKYMTTQSSSRGLALTQHLEAVVEAISEVRYLKLRNEETAGVAQERINSLVSLLNQVETDESFDWGFVWKPAG